MKESDRQIISAFLIAFARRSVLCIGIVALLGVPAAFAMIGADELPRQWRLSASIGFVTVLVLGLCWALMIRGKAVEVRRRGRRRISLAALATLVPGAAAGFFPAPTQDFIALLPMFILTVSMFWIGLAQRA